MRFTSTLVNKVGGRLGDYVGLMGPAGMCLRMWLRPRDAGTAAQLARRAALSTLATAWQETLTQDERDAWGVYGASLIYTSKIGVQYSLSGYDAYVAANGARMVAGLSRVDTAPTLGGFATYSAPTVTAVAATDKISVAYTNTDDWAGEVGGAMIVRESPLALKVGVNYWEGPSRYIGKVTGAVTPPTSPELLSSISAVTAGLRYGVAVRVVRADGRFSPESFFLPVGA